MIRQQSGFTLIELVISLGIIAVLATLALTSYSRHSQRASISTGLALIAPLKLFVYEYYIKNSKFPDSNGQAGLFSASNYSNSHVRSIRVSADPAPGTISIAYKGDRAISEGDSLLLIPSASTSGIRWRCTSFTLLGNLLPANCR
ncbi:MAG: pilin [Gammaproteobacteria bacterium]|nr:pilin [Gammaproteobacteria bacterium]MDH3984936.1 pilin [Gammaproteobacteria bacterium]